MKLMIWIAVLSSPAAFGAVLEETDHLSEATYIWQALFENGYGTDVQILGGAVYVYFDSAQDLNAVAFAAGIAGSRLAESDWWTDKLICAFKTDWAVVWLTSSDCLELCAQSEAGFDVGKAFLGCLNYDNANNW